MQEDSLLSLSAEGFHRIFYRDYGHIASPLILATHGLTRNSSDFHFLANQLEGDYRIVAPDLVGRGKSDYFKDPLNYNFPQYLADLTALIARTGVNKLIWFGTSMGGLLGMIMASLKSPNQLIQALILNDIGPEVPKTALDRLRMYAEVKLVFKDLNEANMALRQIYHPFGLKNEEHWEYLIHNSIVQQEDGTYTLAYDHKAASALLLDDPDDKDGPCLDEEGNLGFWEYWDRLSCPILVLQGRDSDILTDEIIAKMNTRQTKFDHIVVGGVGHAPALFSLDQIEIVQKWLAKIR